jgi:hypothetical protein
MRVEVALALIAQECSSRESVRGVGVRMPRNEPLAKRRTLAGWADELPVVSVHLLLFAHQDILVPFESGEDNLWFQLYERHGTKIPTTLRVSQ